MYQKKATNRNRGRVLEELVETANDYYNSHGLAVIHKIPTPWKVHRKFSPYSKTYEIANAFPEKKSTVDFGGTARSQSVWFDVKSTKQKFSFPFRNIHQHQIEYLKSVDAQGGKAFLLIHSEFSDKTWLLWIHDLVELMGMSERKSIAFSWLDQYCTLIQPNVDIALDYLPAVFETRKEQ